MAANSRTVSRTIDDLPPVASDQELIDWGQTLQGRPEASELPTVTMEPGGTEARRNRPLVATRINRTMSTDEILLDISERATAVYERRVSARRSTLAGRTSTS